MYYYFIRVHICILSKADQIFIHILEYIQKGHCIIFLDKNAIRVLAVKLNE